MPKICNRVPFSRSIATELLDTYGSPLYVYNHDRLVETISYISTAITYPQTRFLFASVTNGNATLLKIFKNCGWGIHANTPGDIHLALAAGFTPEQIVYSGSNLNRQELRQMLAWRVAAIDLDSISQLELLASEDLAIASSPRLGLRLNFPPLTGESRIGIHPNEFPQAIEISRQAGLKIEGLHFYRGTGTNATQAFMSAIDPLLAIAARLPDLTYLDFGGGFGYPYHHDKVAFDWVEFGRVLAAKLTTFDRPIELLLEPGRAAIAGCGVLLARVVASKWQGEKQIIGVDTTVANLAVPAVHGGFVRLFVGRLVRKYLPPMFVVIPLIHAII
jgi:diaminopimelate decarboxylase